ncbi:hypothetical protein BX600DRAFT_514176 [Xylariales sp. PMI_506]|nr:hypothetical protein BX600DRAFT_514176 [Xylariales sp. PMI_506]
MSSDDSLASPTTTTHWSSRRWASLTSWDYTMWCLTLSRVAISASTYTPTARGRAVYWLKRAVQQETYDHLMKIFEQLPQRFHEICNLATVSEIRAENHVWRDLELEGVPAG